MTKNEKLAKQIYDHYSDARNLRNRRWEYFNDRNLKEFIDDSELRVTGYVPPREEQGKESWQANVFHPVTRNKLKAILASVALDLPQVRVTAANEKSRKDRRRASIMEALIKHSYQQENKEEELFFEAWELCSKGTVIIYDGYMKSKAKRKVITSFDVETGEIETKEEEVVTDNNCVSFIVPLMNLYIGDWKTINIQDQPYLCWVERMRKEDFDEEFGKYKNHEKVKTAAQLTVVGEMDTYFKQEWENRTSPDEPIEVVRYYNKNKDQFIIMANGVILLDSPLLLGKKKKWYPFAKSIYEPFATDFFYGNSLPNTLMGEQDIINALYNMAIDRTYKSMMANLIIGNTNKDDFDLEDNNVGVDTRIYVQDINQVKELPIKSLQEGDIKMIDIIGKGLDLTSVDQNQQGVQGRGVTAREVVIANENAKKLKGILYMFLVSMWIQKLKLRIRNILTYYTKPKIISISGESGGKDNILDKYQTYIVEGMELSTGLKGNMALGVVPTKEELPKREEVDVQENMMRYRSGEEYEMVVITSDYLDDWEYDVSVVSETVYIQESSITQAKMEDKLRVFSTMFPQEFMLNKEKLIKDYLIALQDDPEEYDYMSQVEAMSSQNPQAAMAQAMPPAEPGAEAATTGQQGMSPLQGLTPKP